MHLTTTCVRVCMSKQAYNHSHTHTYTHLQTRKYESTQQSALYTMHFSTKDDISIFLLATKIFTRYVDRPIIRQAVDPKLRLAPETEFWGQYEVRFLPFNVSRWKNKPGNPVNLFYVGRLKTENKSCWVSWRTVATLVVKHLSVLFVAFVSGCSLYMELTSSSTNGDCGWSQIFLQLELIEQ